MTADSNHIHDNNDESNVNTSSSWDQQAEFLLQQGKVLYHSWTATDAGLPEFQAALQVLLGSKTDLEAEVQLWLGHAHAKLKHYDEAAQAYYQAIALLQVQQNALYSADISNVYQRLGQLYQDAGQPTLSNQAFWQVLRMEPTLWGELLPEFAHLTTRIQDSWALESLGDEHWLAGDTADAVQAYKQASLVERGMFNPAFDVETPQMAMVLRKAALTRITTAADYQAHPLSVYSCAPPQVHRTQKYCLLLDQAERDFMVLESRPRAATLYFQAIRSYEQETAAPAQMGILLTLLWILLPILIVMGVVLQAPSPIHFPTVMESAQAWVKAQWMYGYELWNNFVKAWKKVLLKSPANEKNNDNQSTAASSLSTATTNPTVDVVNKTEQDADLSSSLLQQQSILLGPEIVPAAHNEEDILPSDHLHDSHNIASSVESLGRLLAGFETDMSSNDHHDDIGDLSLGAPHMVPIE